MSKIITRFAPSPTGMLHIGNVRTALINYLYTRHHHGKFILRIDDTDLERSKKEYEEALKYDLKSLGIEWDETFNQIDRMARYEEIKQKLIRAGRLYPCFETPEELEIKRKIQLSNGKPPIYDRAALKLSEQQVQEYRAAGRKPHYRFLINDSNIDWQDMVKGAIKYQGSKLSDPIIIREDGSMTYMLCSTIDDIDSKITHVIRGEDHVSNTAIQIQMFEALGAEAPIFGHLGLIKGKEEKISKREGGYDIKSLIEHDNIHPMTLNSFLALIGTSKTISPHKTLDSLIRSFDIEIFSTSPTTYDPSDLESLNQKLLIELGYDEILSELTKHNLQHIDEKFWLAVRPNINKIRDLKAWWDICHLHQTTDKKLNNEVIKSAIELLPQEITSESWKVWTKEIAQSTGIKGRELFMTLRLAITGLDSGPELQNLLPLLKHDELMKRLRHYL